MKIAIFGKLRSGKSIVAEEIQYITGAEIIEFGTAVQEVVNVLYPQLEGKKDREKLISVGQHLRKLDKDVWVNVVKNRVLNSSSKDIIVAGVRQENEYQMLKELGFKFIKVCADQDVRISRGQEANDLDAKGFLNDETELAMDLFEADFEIINNRGFKELKEEIKSTLAILLAQEISLRNKRDLKSLTLEMKKILGAQGGKNE